MLYKPRIMKSRSKLKKIFMLRLTIDDASALDGAAARFDLNPSEIARRAIRVGLKEFRKIDIPGARPDREGRDD